MAQSKYMTQKGSAAMLAIKRSAGVAPEVNLRNLLRTGEEACKRGIHYDFETRTASPEVQTMGVSGQTKKTHVLKNLKS